MGGSMGHTAKKRRAVGMNFILWFAFVVFALVLLLVFLAVQSLLVGQQYRSQTVASIREASARMTAALETAGGGSADIRRELHSVETEFGVIVRFLDTDGNVLNAEEGETFLEIARAMEERLAEGEDEAFLFRENAVEYATVVTWEGQTGYLYIVGSIARIHSLEEGLWIISLMSALFAVVLAFVVSGFVAMVIAGPVTEVTDRAKALARGDFTPGFKRGYFCSEIDALSEALDYARTEISKADSMQKELIANVSHDFRTPLTMIKAYASMILEISGDDKEKRDTHARVIIDETDRLAALVEDVLDLSRLRAGVGEQAPAVFNLSDLVYGIAERFDYLRQTQGYVFALAVEEEIYAYAEKSRIEQVVYNLIGNAVNYTGADKLVDVRLFRTEGGARLEIRDTGKGIPPEELAGIWDRYYRLRETHKRPVKGSGLGLSIVKNILVTQGCPYGVESEVGKGSLFWVEFPLPPEEQNKDSEASAEGRGEEQA